MGREIEKQNAAKRGFATHGTSSFGIYTMEKRCAGRAVPCIILIAWQSYKFISLCAMLFGLISRQKGVTRERHGPCRTCSSDKARQDRSLGGDNHFPTYVPTTKREKPSRRTMPYTASPASLEHQGECPGQLGQSTLQFVDIHNLVDYGIDGESSHGVDV